MGVVALILGILGFLASGIPFVGVVLGLLAIILGIVGKKQLNEQGRSTGVALGGIVMGALALVSGLALTTACLLCGSILDNAASNPSNSSPSATSSSSGPSKLSAFESNLNRGQVHAEGPDALHIGNTVRQAVEPGDALGVKVIPGTPRKIVAIVRFADSQVETLADMSEARRREQINGLIEAVDDAYGGAGAEELVVGIRGTLFYGAVGVRRPGQPVEYHTGSIVSTDAIEAALSATPGAETEPVITVGQTVSGQLQPMPQPQPRYVLQLAAPQQIRVQLATGLPIESSPIVEVCRGNVRHIACTEQTEIPPLQDVSSIPDLQENEEVFVLQPGLYTIALFAAPPIGSAVPNTNLAYTLTLR